MSASYGGGILWVLGGSDGSEADQLVKLRRFADLGLTPCFREMFETRVVEYTRDKRKRVTSRWLPSGESAPIAAAGKSVGGSAPYSSFPESLDIQVYVPGARREGVIEMPGSRIDGWGFRPLERAIKACASELEDDEVEDPEFVQSLIRDMRVCAEHKLVFTIEY